MSYTLHQVCQVIAKGYAMMRENQEPCYMPPECSQIRIVEHSAFGFDQHGLVICGIITLHREPNQEIICGLAESWSCH